MEIDPIILLPGAAIAVLLMILYIRLVAGRREVLLEEGEVKDFLGLQAPDLTLDHLVISRDRKSALVIWQGEENVGIVCSFGNKLVLQSVQKSALSYNTERTVHIPRQGLTHPAVVFQAPDDMPTPFLLEGVK